MHVAIVLVTINITTHIVRACHMYTLHSLQAVHDTILLQFYGITIVMVIMSMADTATESARQFINSIVHVYIIMCIPYSFILYC